MILEDSAIFAACARQPHLISNFDPQFVSNCTYSFRVGRVFKSDSGEEYLFGTKGTSASSMSRHFSLLGPSEILVVTTIETVSLPDDVMMTYTPLNSLASSGIMLLNASIVEPGYQGPLSCVLVNFGALPAQISPGDRIAKAVFFKLASRPSKPKPLVIGVGDYHAQSAKAAGRYHKTFLDINSVVDTAKKEASSAARQSVLYGGLVIAILIAFAQLEPLFTKWLREKPGLSSSSTNVELERREAELRANQTLLEAQKAVDNLQKKLAEIEKRDSKAPKAQK